MLNKKWIAHALLLFATLIWGARFGVVQHAIEIVQLFTFNAIRFLIAGFILLIIQIIYTKRTAVLNNNNRVRLHLTRHDPSRKVCSKQKEESAQAA